MGKKYVYIIAIIVAIILIIGYLIYYKFFRTEKEFILDTEDKYIITTNASTLTAMSDGGTHYDVRYNVDLARKKVTKVQDYYKGFEGLKYKNRIIFEKKLKDKEIEELKALLNEIKEVNVEKNSDSTFMGYTIEHLNYEKIEINSKEYINKIEELLGK